MSKFTDSMANELVHFEIYGAPTTDLVIIKVIDSDGNTIHSLLATLAKPVDAVLKIQVLQAVLHHGMVQFVLSYGTIQTKM